MSEVRYRGLGMGREGLVMEGLGLVMENRREGRVCDSVYGCVEHAEILLYREVGSPTR